MTDPLGNWQGATLHLPSALRLSDCERIDWQQMRFPAAAVTLDAADLQEIDSIGVAALVKLVREARGQGIALDWVHVGRPLKRMLAVYELDNGAFLTCRNN